MTNEPQIQRETDRAQHQGTLEPGRAITGTLPGDEREGSHPEFTTGGPDTGLDMADVDEEMEIREAALSQAGSGSLAPGVNVGTPAGGSTASGGAVATGTAREPSGD
jgi:hypothetical protein